MTAKRVFIVIPTGVLVIFALLMLAPLAAHIPQESHRRDSGNPDGSAHDPYVVGSLANNIVTGMTGSWNPNRGSDQQHCAELVVGGQVVRYSIWQFTHNSATGVPRGNLAWYHADTNIWGGRYNDASGNTLPNTPQDIKEK